MSELKPLSRRKIEELFLIEKPVLIVKDVRSELDIQNTVTAIYEALPNINAEILSLRKEVERKSGAFLEATNELIAMGKRAETAEAEVKRLRGFISTESYMLDEVGFSVDGDRFRGVLAKEGTRP